LIHNHNIYHKNDMIIDRITKKYTVIFVKTLDFQ